MSKSAFEKWYGRNQYSKPLQMYSSKTAWLASKKYWLRWALRHVTNRKYYEGQARDKIREEIKRCEK